MNSHSCQLFLVVAENERDHRTHLRDVSGQTLKQIVLQNVWLQFLEPFIQFVLEEEPSHFLPTLVASLINNSQDFSHQAIEVLYHRHFFLRLIRVKPNNLITIKSLSIT